MDNDNNFVNVVDCIINIVVMDLDIVMLFDDFEIVPYKISKDNLDQWLLNLVLIQ